MDFQIFFLLFLIGAVVGIFLGIRYFTLWYFKIDVVIKHLERMIFEQKMALDVLHQQLIIMKRGNNTTDVVLDTVVKQNDDEPIAVE